MTTRFERKVLKFGEFRLALTLCDLEDYLCCKLGKAKGDAIVNRIEGEILGEQMDLSDIEDLLRNQGFGMMDTKVDSVGHGVREFVRDDSKVISVITSNYLDKEAKE